MLLPGPSLSPLGVSRRRRSSGAPTSPVAGYTLWLKADAGVLDGLGSPATDGVAVATWQDQSGNGNDAAQATAINRPVYKTGIVNGKPVLRFDNSVHQQGIAHAATNFHYPWTAFYVARMTPGGFYKARVLQGYNNNWLMGFWNGAEDQAYYNGPIKLDGTPSAATAWKLYAGKSPDENVGYLYSAGSLLASGGSGGAPKGYGPNGLGINAGTIAGSEASDCDVAEILIYPAALSDADRAATEAYLNGKYAIY